MAPQARRRSLMIARSAGLRLLYSSGLRRECRSARQFRPGLRQGLQQTIRNADLEGRYNGLIGSGSGAMVAGRVLSELGFGRCIPVYRSIGVYSTIRQLATMVLALVHQSPDTSQCIFCEPILRSKYYVFRFQILDEGLQRFDSFLSLAVHIRDNHQRVERLDY
jgi:hypothetical protein